MKTKKLTPRNAAPVQRKNTATVSRDGKLNGFYFGSPI
ncbi:MAG: anacyclamide/piricyclamide family prenylated cyclic peptide [Microcystis aeruginosa L211-101]|jgi:prenylated cyclic peptide (anacyclamide/piricyclamide family)|nr:anacyclamide/piricyclamide family prenylated cyclic peptide [Microcystis aeruginosa L211-11]NCR33417.1 anacyclamide/piricyclamide family prenylated cyclic peptide [Microcystis aeruginosa L211-101]NCT46359.1 anacyclamide/piricyclamide family prenylated cyclic peptide [Microcystis aeruginosa G11-09]